LQQEHINPKEPRAIFFNDTVSVGSVQHGRVFEITVNTAETGVNFYTLDVAKSDQPKFDNDRSLCILCHNYTFASQVSVAKRSPGDDATTAYLGGDLFRVTDPRAPFEDRWGGWYVSGTHGKMKHLGNAVSHNPFPPLELDTEDTQN